MTEKIEREMRRFLKANADKAIVTKYAKYFKEGYDPYGVDGEKLLGKIEEWFDVCQEKLDRRQLLTLCEHLLSSGKYEEVGIAIHFMAKLRDKYNKSL
ncbi:MAG: DNA alkylation repair protein, partial [Candidatus Zixiibacteriota bacterium]